MKGGRLETGGPQTHFRGNAGVSTDFVYMPPQPAETAGGATPPR